MANIMNIKQKPETVDALFVFVLSFLVVLLYGRVFTALSYRINSILVQVSLLCIPITYCIMHDWKIKTVFSCNITNPAFLFPGACIAIGLQICSWLIGIKISHYISLPDSASVPLMNLVYDDVFIISFLIIVILPAISEEFLFRGFILSALNNQFKNTSIIIGALLFAFIHLDPIRLLSTFVAGLSFGWIRLKSKSIVVCIWMHLLYNSIPLILLRNPKLLKLNANLNFTSHVLLFCFGILLVFTGLYLIHARESRSKSNS